MQGNLPVSFGKGATEKGWKAPRRCPTSFVWFSRTWRAQPLPLWFVKKSRKNRWFHEELFIAFASLFFTRLRGDRSDRHSRATDHLCHLPVCAGRVPSLSRSLTASSQLLSALTARCTSEWSGSPITASRATISLSGRTVLETNIRLSRCLISLLPLPGEPID
jgi:hypothetical protein